MFISFINTEGGNTEELEQQISALTQELTTVTDEYASVIDRTVSSVTIPEGTETVGKNAFADCSAITEATISSDVATIKTASFANNKSLATINFEGNTPPTIEEGAFSMLPVDVEVVVPSGATGAYSAVTEEIENSTIPYVIATDNPATGGSAYTNTYVDGAVPAYAYRGWASVKVEMSNNITHIGFRSFYNMSQLSSLTISTGITTLEMDGLALLRAVSGGYDFPNIITVGDWALSNSGYEAITFGEHLNALGDYVFSGDTHLSSITFNTPSPTAITWSSNDNVGINSHNGELRVNTGLTGFDLSGWLVWKLKQCPDWTLCDLEGNSIEPAKYVVFFSGNTVEIYEPSGTTISNDDADLPQGDFTKIMTKGIEELDDNCFIYINCDEYVFDANLTKSKCTPFWQNAQKITFKATALDNTFDARLFSSAGGGIDCSSLTFYTSACPTYNIAYYDTAVTLGAGHLYVPVNSTGWHNLIQSGLTSAWTVYDVANTSHQLGSVVYTTSASTESDWFYQAPNNAQYVFHNEILSAKIDKLGKSGGQTFQGCTNMSAITICTKADGGNIELEGNFCYGCSSLAQITTYGSALSLSDSGYDNNSGYYNQFSGVSATGELRVNTGHPHYDYYTWQSEMGMAGLSDWTLCDLAGNAIPEPSEPMCEIQDAHNLLDCGVYIESGTTPNPIRVTYENQQPLTLVDGRILYMQPIGEFSVNIDGNGDIEITDNSTMQPITPQQQEAIEQYLQIGTFEENGNYYYLYEFWGEYAPDDITVDDDDYTGMYSDCDCIG